MLDAKRRCSIATMECSATGRVFEAPDGLVFDESRQGVVEIQLVETDLNLGRAHMALEQGLHRVGLWTGKETRAFTRRR